MSVLTEIWPIVAQHATKKIIYNYRGRNVVLHVLACLILNHPESWTLFHHRNSLWTFLRLFCSFKKLIIFNGRSTNEIEKKNIKDKQIIIMMIVSSILNCSDIQSVLGRSVPLCFTCLACMGDFYITALAQILDHSRINLYTIYFI